MVDGHVVCIYLCSVHICFNINNARYCCCCCSVFIESDPRAFKLKTRKCWFFTFWQGNKHQRNFTSETDIKYAFEDWGMNQWIVFVEPSYPLMAPNAISLYGKSYEHTDNNDKQESYSQQRIRSFSHGSCAKKIMNRLETTTTSNNKSDSTNNKQKNQKEKSIKHCSSINNAKKRRRQRRRQREIVTNLWRIFSINFLLRYARTHRQAHKRASDEIGIICAPLTHSHRMN